MGTPTITLMDAVTDFDAVARTWDAPDKLERADRVAAAIVAQVPLPPAANALDYGCGTGLNTWPLASHLGHVTLADASPGMIEVAHERVSERPDADRFTVVQLDLTTATLAPATFDLIYAVMSLHHVQQLEPVLQQFLVGLRPGGWLAIADLDADPEGAFHGEGFAGHHGFDRDKLAALLTAAGFTAPTFTTVAQVTKPVAGEDRSFGLFLCVTQRT